MAYGLRMCGRYTLRRADKAIELATGEPSRLEWRERFNVAPTQEMPVVRVRDGSRVVEAMRWGFVPFYERKKEKPRALINARSETIAVKAPFKRAAQRQRCLVPADGFLEWRREERSKTPFFVHLVSDEPFAFAGLWEPAAGEIPAGYLILTTVPNALMERIHNRMPVILRPKDYET